MHADGSLALRPAGDAVTLQQILCVSATAAALLASLFVPQAGLLLGLVACMLCTAMLPGLRPLALLAFVHSGAVIAASRALAADSSDFVVYFDFFSNLCSGTQPLSDNLFTFGAEIGLPLVYGLLSAVGGCHLSINGLAYLQTLLVGGALLLLLLAHVDRMVQGRRAAIVAGGVLILFSFIYVTQLSRQALSSLFVLAALLGNGGRGRTVVLLIAGTLFHLTTPLVFGLAVLFRFAGRKGWIAIAVVVTVAIPLAPRVLEWAISNPEAFVGLAKLSYYAGDADDGLVGSDYRALIYLVVAGLAAIAARRQMLGAARDARMLLGLAAVSVLLLALPLAVTRITLAFSALAIGSYLFLPLALRAPRVALSVLLLAVFFRSGITSVFGPPDQSQWAAYASLSPFPLYYFSAF